MYGTSTITGYTRPARRGAPLFAVPICSLLAFVAVVGARLGEGSALGGFLRSIHVLDLLAPVLFILVAGRFSELVRIFGGAVVWLCLVWSVTALLIGPAGHFLIDPSPATSTIAVSLAFAAKEAEFVLVMLFVGLTAYHRPQAVSGIVLLCCGFLALWAVKEFFLPTGLYYMGLPFEAGPSQTGAVFAIFSFVWWLFLTRNWIRLSWSMRYAVGPTVLLLLIAGNLGSLSRTGQAGLFAGIGALILLGARSRLAALILLPVGYLVYLLAFTEAGTILDLGFANRWSGASDNFPDRVIKWVAMIDFQREHPWTLLFGCGFASPNLYVLYQYSPSIDLGYVLAVDNGFVRRLFEVGLMGSLLYFVLIGSILKRQAATPYFPVAAGAATALFTISMAIEAFQVTQTAASFFLFCGVLIGWSRADADGIA